MKQFKLTKKEEFSMIVNDRLERLHAHGITQTEIGIYLGVSDRTVRKWEYFESCPSGQQFWNLVRLCKEIGA